MFEYRTFLKVVFLSVFVLTTISCDDDFFELERPPQNPWLTVEDFERAPIGAYGVLFASHEWYQAWSNYAVVITSMGDDVEWVHEGRWGYWRNTIQGSDRTQLTETNIWLLYRGIGAINVALDFVEEHNGNPYPTATPEEIEHDVNRIIGELHFLRGFCYYMLQTTFGHPYVPGGDNSDAVVPMVTSYATSSSEATNPKIGTTQEVWDFIRDEFLLAKQLLPKKYDPALHDPSFEVRANGYAASGMLMRTYFQRGEYQQAEEEATFLIEENEGNFDLTEDPIEAFNKSELTARGREVIWYLPYSDETLRPDSHLSVLNATYDGEPSTWNETRMAAHVLRDLGWMNDPTTELTFGINALRDKRFQQLIQVRYPKGKALPGQEVDTRPEVENIVTVWPWKYYRGPKLDFTNVPMIRLAEVYLTRSIIRFMDNDKQGAADDLNIVRERAWDEVVAGEAYTPVTSGEITADMIHLERLIEMFNEADRLNYLRALKMDIPNGARGEGSEPYTSNAFIWPLPLSEVIYNENFN